MTTFRMQGAKVPQNTLRIRQVACLNCSVTLVGDFCHHCGQAASTPAKVTFGQIVREVPRAVWDFERALPNTLIGLLLRPGRIIRDFLAGRRAKIYSPLALLFIVSGLLGVATSSLHLHQVAQADSAALTEKLFAYYSWIIALCVPVLAIGPAIVLRRRLGLGYGEQFMVATMAVTGLMTLGLLFAPFEWYANTHGSFWTGWAVQLGGSALKLIYLAWAYAQLQDDGKEGEWAITRWLRGFASVLASYLALLLMLCVVSLVVVLCGLAYVQIKKSSISLQF